MMSTKFTKAFTLIELLIVIVIIGILAVALLPKLKGMQDKARYARVENDFSNSREVAFLAQTSQKKLMIDITGNGRTAGGCRGSGTWLPDIRNLPSNHPCKTQLIASLQKISLAAGLSSGALSYLELDPWGSPYVFDENDGGFGVDGCLYKDSIRTSGPDGNMLTLGDNKGMHLRPVFCTGAH